MKFSREDVIHIAALAKIAMTEDEITNFSVQLSNVMENFEILNKVDTTNILPTSQPNALSNVMREDEIESSLDIADVFANASNREGDFFRIHSVLE
ncbi:MAG: Asp-tRNA(Asn)/Glu-tRNA(Gln) amidotransferase subunit GatC [Dehalococcoidia bacterium]|nr:Asp-tRNA(Asn)/Glu-tRNA(Gln) amidotransferase subunit GatC [Dehalococcoidia bacterium]